MMIRSVALASVCTVLLAATAAGPVSAAAEKPREIQLVEEAYKNLLAGKAKEAVARYSEAIESRALGANELARALLNRALAWQNLGQHREAIDDYSTAMRLDALSARMRAVALYNRGLSQLKLDQPARAIDDFTNALFLDAEFSQAYYSRANALRQAGQFLFALSDYEKSLRYQHPERYLPYYGEALTYRSLRRTEQAQKALLLALTANPDFQPAKDLLRQISNGEGAPPVKEKRVLNLATSEEMVQAAGAADGIVTGSLQTGQPDLVMRKTNLPDAKRPPASLLPERDEDEVKTASLVTSTRQVAAIVAGKQPVAVKKDIVANQQPAAEPVQESEARAEEAVEMPEGWTVQLSSQRNADAAWSVWKKLTAKHGRLLVGSDPLVYKADLGAQGIYYRLRVNRIESRRAAQSLCAKLKSRGTSCFVSNAQG